MKIKILDLRAKLLPIIVLLACLLLTACSGVSEQVRQSYHVLSVMRYMEIRTTGRGGIIGQDLKYIIYFVDGEGKLVNRELSYTESQNVQLGERDEYITNGHGEGVLYLTEETLGGLR